VQSRRAVCTSRHAADRTSRSADPWLAVAPATITSLDGNLKASTEVMENSLADSPFFGMTPLIMNATQRDDCSEVAELLIAAGADLDATDATGKSALAQALERGLARITAVLRRHGAREPAAA
jgi:ankyrin repeat protein